MGVDMLRHLLPANTAGAVLVLDDRGELVPSAPMIDAAYAVVALIDRVKAGERVIACMHPRWVEGPTRVTVAYAPSTSRNSDPAREAIRVALVKAQVAKAGPAAPLLPAAFGGGAPSDPGIAADPADFGDVESADDEAAGV